MSHILHWFIDELKPINLVEYSSFLNRLIIELAAAVLLLTGVQSKDCNP